MDKFPIPITPEKVDGLLQFLPLFQQPNREFIVEWQGMSPVYEADVVAFFKLAGQSCWMDTSYKPNEAGKMVRDDAFITQANLAEIKTMLTFCVRGERFSDGHWEAMLRNGRIQAILTRLQILFNYPIHIHK